MEVNQILIVDDDEAMLRLLSACVTAGGHRATTAKSGEEALTRLESLTPDLIIADILMPGMKGYEFCRKVREIKQDYIPFIFCSALGDHPERVRGLRVGADDYIVKPINATELLLKIEKLIGKNKQLRDLARKAEDAAKIGIMSGSLDNVWIGDILQIFSFLDIPHACLIVSNAANKTGEIYIEKRHLTHARTGNLSGMKAFCRILSWKEGKYKAEIRKWTMEHSLTGPLENFLMEGATQMDEFIKLRDSIMKDGKAFRIETNPNFQLQKVGENEWSMFKIIGANHNLDTILDISPFTDYETMQIINELYNSGAIKITSETPNVA